MQVFNEAANQILKSDSLRTTLGLFLNIVNAMNSGMANKQIYGFKLDFLSKLGDIKTSDKKSNLLSVICNCLVTSPEYSTLAEKLANELKSVQAASRFDFGEFSRSIKTLKDGYIPIEKEKDHLDKYAADDKFVPFFTKFQEDANATFNMLDDTLQCCIDKLKLIISNFDESEKEILEKPQDFLKMISEFVIAFKKTMDELLEEQKKQKEKEARQAAKQQQNLVDSIGSKIKDGSAVNDKKQKKHARRNKELGTPVNVDNIVFK